jgi:hypothetical protein
VEGRFFGLFFESVASMLLKVGFGYGVAVLAISCAGFLVSIVEGEGQQSTRRFGYEVPRCNSQKWWQHDPYQYDRDFCTK